MIGTYDQQLIKTPAATEAVVSNQHWRPVCTISLQLPFCDMQLLFNYDFITHHHHPDRRDVDCFTTAAFN